MGIKGQVSTEYLVMIGFVLVILVPIVIIYFNYTGSTSDTISSAKTSQVAKEIVKASNEVSSFGEGSQKKIKISFPDGLTSINFDNKEIIFRFKDSKGNENEIVEVADVNFAAYTIPFTPGVKDLVVKSLADSVVVQVACNDGQTTISEDAVVCNSLCNAVPNCNLLCSNKAWICQP